MAVPQPSVFLAELDAVDFLTSLPRSSINCIVTDPPYESLEKHRAVGTTTRLSQSAGSSNEWFKIFPNARFQSFFEASFIALAPNSHLYVFCDQETMFHIKPIGERAGFRFWKPIVWDKVSIGMGYHYRCRHEFILFFEKGKRRLNSLSVPDVLTVPRVHRGYPTEKPLDLVKILVSQSTSPGQIVADPFMGSGTSAMAALDSNCSFAGSDISSNSLTHVRARIGGAASEKPMSEFFGKPDGQQALL